MSHLNGLCQHCGYHPAVRVLVWDYPDETYSLEAALCSGCAAIMRERHTQGHVIVTEDESLIPGVSGWV